MPPITSTTPRNRAKYTATADLSGVSIVSDKAKSPAVYSWRDLSRLVAHIQAQNTVIPLWTSANEPSSVEGYLLSQGLKPLCGCIADLLEKTGLAAITETGLGHVGIQKV